MVFLLLLLTAAPALAKDRPVDIRLYSLHKLRTLILEPDGEGVFAGERQLKGEARVSIRGQLVVLDGPDGKT